ncbi:hypothetical protein H0H87_000270 [Tephrocybe sp. NHM501043]|nr:hypothetical protein H0H87_000270 [Tephrocybe sp. NHM501043]
MRHINTKTSSNNLPNPILNCEIVSISQFNETGKEATKPLGAQASLKPSSLADAIEPITSIGVARTSPGADARAIAATEFACIAVARSAIWVVGPTATVLVARSIDGATHAGAITVLVVVGANAVATVRVVDTVTTILVARARGAAAVLKLVTNGEAT